MDDVTPFLGAMWKYEEWGRDEEEGWEERWLGRDGRERGGREEGGR